jgi:hypothetical protein
MVRRAVEGRRQRLDGRGLVLLMNGVLAGVGGVFLATASVPVTGIAAATAVVIAVVVMQRGG